MLINKASDIRSSEITDKKVYLNRREFIRAGATAAAGLAGAAALGEVTLSAKGAPHGRKLANIKKGFAFNAVDKINAWEDITSYNNYYEFGTDKSDPAENARNFKTLTVTVETSARRRDEPRGRAQRRDARGAGLSASLRRSGR